MFSPWTSLWDRNRFADLIPAVGALMASRYARGAVTGVGIVTTIIGMGDLVVLIFFRARVPPAAPQVDPPAAP
jgi:hypothetical protein